MEMINVKERNPSFSRKPEEIIKFKCLVKTLLWVQSKAGRTSAEIVSLTLRNGKTVLENSCHF